MNRNRRDLTRRFLPNFFLLPYGTLPKAGAILLAQIVEIVKKLWINCGFLLLCQLLGAIIIW